MKPDKPAPIPAEQAPRLVKAKVRQHNRYGNHVAGEIVKVEERELRRVPHCLVALDEAAREEQAAVTPGPTSAQLQSRAMRQQARHNAKLAQEAQAALARQRLEAMGLTVTAAPPKPAP